MDVGNLKSKKAMDEMRVRKDITPLHEDNQ
jgi:hypothetical protein